ncbi:MAG: hypothetical protein ABIY90_18595 [Puia sp.]
MFISANQLHREMGVDIAIARFFVDRPVPKDNSFWKGKLLYIGFGNGYLSIPVYYDLLHKIGVPLDLLLGEEHIHFMEKLMHYAIEQERKKISITEEQLAIRELLKGRIKNPDWYLLLCDYLDQEILKPMHVFGLDQPSLNRADVFLYVLCDLPLKEKHWKLAVRYWYALHPTYLLMDDLRDYERDKEQGEENVVLEWGDGVGGFQRVMDRIRTNCNVLKEVNPRLAEFFLSYEEDLLEIIPKTLKRVDG